MSDQESRYKVAKVAAKFGLSDIEDQLVERWTDERNASSLRELATTFNHRVLRAAMEDAGMDPLDGEVENTYRLLTDDNVSSGVRTETRKQLERDGIEVDQLESSFVTYQAVRTYLKECRDLDYERGNDDRIGTVKDNVKRLENRTVTVTEEKLSQLDRADHIDLGEFRVLLNLRVLCKDCGTQYEIGELLEQSGCNCETRE